MRSLSLSRSPRGLESKVRQAPTKTFSGSSANYRGNSAFLQNSRFGKPCICLAFAAA